MREATSLMHACAWRPGLPTRKTGGSEQPWDLSGPQRQLWPVCYLIDGETEMSTQSCILVRGLSPFRAEQGQLQLSEIDLFCRGCLQDLLISRMRAGEK